jgi:hypothetical protein
MQTNKFGKLLAYCYYDEFEFEGKKILSGIKPEKGHLDNRPACYLYEFDNSGLDSAKL